MTLPDGFFEIGEFLTGLAQNLTHQQLRLDREYEKRIEEFLPILQLANDLGYEEFARTLAPLQMILDKADLQLDILLSEAREQQFSISVRPLNLGYTRKYQYSDFVQSTLRFEVRTIPFPPASPLA